MAKDYFQDIVPPSDDRDTGMTPPPAPRQRDDSEPRSIPINTNAQPIPSAAPAPERSIRNISAPVRPKPRIFTDDRMPPANLGSLPRTRGRSKRWLWILAGILVLVLAALAFVALRDTTVTVTPRVQSVTFDPSTSMSAYPAETAATGTLAYTVQAIDLEDSEIVKSQGTVHAEDKASGTITVYNDSSTSPLHYVKTTRFEAPNGLIYRAPADIVVPGKKGTTPGQVTITVIADKPGEQYNIGPTDKFTLPGLKGSAAYNTVYARSTTPMTGGFIGERAGVSPADTQAAMSVVRSRLEAKAASTITSSLAAGTVGFPELAQITYQDMPNTTEADGTARIHQKATVRVPVFPADAFAATIARSASADAEGASVRLVGGAGYGAENAATSTTLGAEPVVFGLRGTAQLIWNVDAGALATALAGKEQSAFEAIVANFPSIDKADARIQPFWKKTFPTDPAAIKITVEDPAAAL